MGLILGALVGFTFAVFKRTLFDLKGAKTGVKILSKKRNGEAIQVGAIAVVLIVVVSLWGSGRFG